MLKCPSTRCSQCSHIIWFSKRLVCDKGCDIPIQCHVIRSQWMWSRKKKVRYYITQLWEQANNSKRKKKKRNLDCDHFLPAILFLKTGSPVQVLCYFVLWQDVFQMDFDNFLPFLKNFFCCVAPHMLSKYYNCSGASPCSTAVRNSQSQIIGLCLQPWCS